MPARPPKKWWEWAGTSLVTIPNLISILRLFLVPVTIWLLAALMMLSAFAGECVPQAGDACAGGRTMTLLWIAAGAAALNALALGLVAWLRRR